jgi:hypothetical protein
MTKLPKHYAVCGDESGGGAKAIKETIKVAIFGELIYDSKNPKTTLYLQPISHRLSMTMTMIVICYPPNYPPS